MIGVCKVLIAAIVGINLSRSRNYTVLLCTVEEERVELRLAAQRLEHLLVIRQWPLELGPIECFLDGFRRLVQVGWCHQDILSTVPQVELEYLLVRGGWLIQTHSEVVLRVEVGLLLALGRDATQ